MAEPAVRVHSALMIRSRWAVAGVVAGAIVGLLLMVPTGGNTEFVEAAGGTQVRVYRFSLGSLFILEPILGPAFKRLTAATYLVSTVVTVATAAAVALLPSLWSCSYVSGRSRLLAAPLSILLVIMVLMIGRGVFFVAKSEWQARNVPSWDVGPQGELIAPPGYEDMPAPTPQPEPTER